MEMTMVLSDFTSWHLTSGTRLGKETPRPNTETPQTIVANVKLHRILELGLRILTDQTQ
jgi:hypothetical protein